MFFTKKSLLRLSLLFLKAAPNFFAFSVEVILRKRFGERYLTWSMMLKTYFGVIFSLGLFQIWYWLFRKSWPFYEVHSGPVQATSQLLFMGGFVWHKLVGWVRSKKGNQWDSQSPGEARFLFKLFGFSDSVNSPLFRFIEPALVFALGYFFQQTIIDGSVTIWLYAASASLFVKRQIQYYAKRKQQLDLIDSRQRAHELQSALTPRKEKTEKLPVVALARTSFGAADRRLLEQVS